MATRVLGTGNEEPRPVPWSFHPLIQAPLPHVDDKGWSLQRLDRFTFAKMAAAGLKPSDRATSRDLVRRLYYDLIGLPPSLEESMRWEPAVAKPDGVRRLVDELLGSAHYGERWGRYWLDLARYTDETPDWLDSTKYSRYYRDWVVRAFNEDMPYDLFVMRQLATDQMPGEPLENRYALGFLGLSPTYFKELQLPPEIIRTTVADEWEEHVDAVGRTFLGLTLACARCHDHKSDPITAEDYYALAGVFASVKLAEIPTVPTDIWAPVAKARGEVAELEKKAAELKKKKPQPSDLKAQLANIDQKIASITTSTPHYNLPMANGLEEAALFVVNADSKKGTKMDYRMGMARDLELQKRGDPNSLGQVVPRRFLAAFPCESGKPRRFATGSGRIELAKAIVQDARPLAARVIVNRVWKHHFGRGLVDTPSEFGNLGDAPSHPELLDDLTARFIANGWSIKWLHREILLSATWQQGSFSPESEMRDPENRLLSRMQRRRLDFEAWRDSMLKVCGRLDERVGGESAALTLEGNVRRTLYGTINRHEMEPMLRLHDFPDPGAHSPSRPETTTPLQLLFTLNSPFMQQQSDALAGRLCGAAGAADLNRCIRTAYELLYQRAPTVKEESLGMRFLAGREGDRSAWAEYAQVLLGANEFLFID